MNLIGIFSFLAMPAMCMRHEESGPVTYSAPVAMCLFIFSSPIRVETAGSSMENMPPKPQHSSFLSGSWMVMPSTSCKRSMILLNGLTLHSEGDDRFSSLTPWQLLCTLTGWGNYPGTSFTFSTSWRNSTISMILPEETHSCLPFRILG